MNKKNIFILGGSIFFLLILFIVLFMIFRTNKLSQLEKKMIEDKSNEVVSYIYDITNDNYSENEKYVLYALDYYLYDNGNNSVTSSEISELIKNIFDKKITEDEIVDLGITPEMIDRNVMYNYEMNTFVIDNSDVSKKEIADKSIISYRIDKMRKKGNKYYVDYTEFTIDNPYEILNYYNDLTEEYRSNNTVYNDQNEAIHVDADVTPFDASDIISYLNGEKNRKVLDDYLSDDLLEKKGNVTGKVKVTYLVRGDNIYIYNIKTE